MESQPKRMDIEAAKEDLKIRTLAQMGNDFARLLLPVLVEGLQYRRVSPSRPSSFFSESAAIQGTDRLPFKNCSILSSCRRLESLVVQIDRFIRSSHKDYQSVVECVGQLAGRTTPPCQPVCDRLAADLFRSNIKTAMALLKSSQRFQEGKSQSASPRPLLGQ